MSGLSLPVSGMTGVILLVSPVQGGVVPSEVLPSTLIQNNKLCLF